MPNRIKIAVAGATGYVGLDLVLLLSKHPNIKIVNLCSTKNIGKTIQSFDKRIKKKLPKLSKIEKVDWEKIDLLFLSLPNGEAQKIVKKLFYKFPKLKFIDLSADFRISNHKEYKKWYKIDHSAKELIKKSLYSITEFNKKKLKNSRLISNPGCYPTSILLPLVPIIKKKWINIKSITIDSKSGYSGAGKTFSQKFKYKDLFQSIFAYSVIKHRHLIEIEQEIKKQTEKKIRFVFTPHVIPTYRGILSTIHIETKNKVNTINLKNKLKKFYKKDKFVKICNSISSVSTGNVLNTNRCNILISNTRYNNRIIVFSTIDNLVKGASGQAIQNMNMIYGLREDIGLE